MLLMLHMQPVNIKLTPKTKNHQKSSSAPSFFFLPDLVVARACLSYISATCSGPVASSAPLSSRIRINRGKRRDIPLSSTCVVSQHIYGT